MKSLSSLQIDSFINKGFVKIENAFPVSVAEECRALLWKATGYDPDNPQSWTEPVVRISEMRDEPFKKAVNTEILHYAFDQLVGKDNWLPRDSLGAFPIRFPNKKNAGDTGWHVDSSFPADDSMNFSTWRINVFSRGRALLMLFLFSDVGEMDAPTLIKVGSHAGVAKLLEPEGERGLSFMELANKLGTLPKYEEAVATGKAGTVYLCHPFIVHAAQDHRGVVPKFMAQPTLLPKHGFSQGFDIYRADATLSPVERAILNGIKV